MNPDIDKLLNSIFLMAEAMKFQPLSDERAKELISHVLYDKEYDGIDGKDNWKCFQHGLLTERELRNVFMAHTATKIARDDGRNEPNCNDYNSIDLCNGFELGLLGKITKPRKVDQLDPWEI